MLPKTARFIACIQGCIFRLTCSYHELTEDHVLTSAYVKFFRTVTRNVVNSKSKSVWRKKDCSWLPLNKYAMNIFNSTSTNVRTGAQFSENQSAPKLENRKTSPCSPRAPNLLHVLPSGMVGWNKLCNPARSYLVHGYLIPWKFPQDTGIPGILLDPRWSRWQLQAHHLMMMIMLAYILVKHAWYCDPYLW